VLFTDDETFGKDGITNFHNQRQWAEEDPRRTIHARHQHEFRINVWAGIGGDCVVGPHVLPQRITCNIYRYFLLNGLPRPLENVPSAVRARFMHDGAPAHCSQPVRDVLNNTCHGNG
jgi:hypothetical protein